MIDGICILVSKTFFIYQILFASFISNTTVAICGAGTDYPPGTPEFIPDLVEFVLLYLLFSA